MTPKPIDLQKPARPTKRAFSVTRPARDTQPARTVNFAYALGDSIEEAVELFGANAVLRLFHRAAAQDVETEARRLLRFNRSGNPLHSEETVAARISLYRVGTDAVAIERALDLRTRLANLDPEALEIAGVGLTHLDGAQNFPNAGASEA